MGLAAGSPLRLIVGVRNTPLRTGENTNILTCQYKPKMGRQRYPSLEY